jgi:hypothetical protein
MHCATLVAKDMNRWAIRAAAAPSAGWLTAERGLSRLNSRTLVALITTIQLFRRLIPIRLGGGSVYDGVFERTWY